MTHDELQSNFNRLQKEFKDFFDKYAPSIVGKTAVSFFKQRFQIEGWERAGDLGRSIEIMKMTSGSVTIWSRPIGSNKVYARVHNEGLRAGRGAGFIMPKRQFMGIHPELNDIIIKELERKLKQMLNAK